MKQRDLLTTTSIVSVLLLALHISQDIIFGFDRAGLNHLVGVALLLTILSGATLLRDRVVGKTIMLFGGLMAGAMMPLHMRHGLQPEFLHQDGALLFVWVLYLLGVIGLFCVVLSISAFRYRAIEPS